MAQHVKTHVMIKFGMNKKSYQFVPMKNRVKTNIIYYNHSINVFKIVRIHMKSKIKYVLTKILMIQLKRKH